MPRGYRVIVIALGLILLGASEAPKQERHQEAQQTVAHPAPTPTPSVKGVATQYQEPCGQEQRNRNSDLCAQWAAADAARDAADWAYIGLWLSGASVAGLLITLGFNYAAWDQARKSKGDTFRALDAADKSADAAARLVETAELNAKKELRAYLDFDGVTLNDWPNAASDGPDTITVLHKIDIVNYGKTPAENVAFTVSHFAKSKSGDRTLLVDEEGEIPFHTIAPSDAAYKQTIIGITAKLMAQFDAGLWTFVSTVYVTYTDVFGDRHVLRSEFESVPGTRSFGIHPSTRVST